MYLRISLFLLFLISIFLTLPSSGYTKPAYGKIGPEFQVNTYTQNSQGGPSVAHLSDGSFVVAWESYEQDGSECGVYGQLFDSSGGKIGSEFRVNTYTDNDQEWPSLAGLSGGGFVVTWHSDGQEGRGWGVYGQLFDSSGNKVGSEFRVYTQSSQDPRVASLSDGGFVVTWVSANGVYGQRFDSSGNKIGSEFRVNTYTTGRQDSPSVACVSGGGFVVTWQCQDRYGVYGQLFDSSGNKVGSEFQVNTYITDDFTPPWVAGLSGGSFVVTWHSGLDGHGLGISAQMFDSSGDKVGSEFQVNTYTHDLQEHPSVTGLSGGGFVVTWNSDGQDGSEYGVYGQLFDSSGGKIGSEFRVNTYTEDSQFGGSVASLSDGGFVVTWGSGDQDGRGGGVYGQLFGETESCSLFGKVTDKKTGKPIKKAKVRLKKCKGCKDRTDENGYYEINDIECGTYKLLKIKKRGYIPYKEKKIKIQGPVVRDVALKKKR